MVPRRLTLPSLLLAFSGCLAGAPDVSSPGEEPALGPSDWVERMLPNGGGHDHMLRMDHANLTTPNFEVLGWNPLKVDHQRGSPGGYFCGDVKVRDGRHLAVVHSFTSDVAFVLIDVSDPRTPTKLGEFIMERTHVWDVAMTPDQRHVVLATSPLGDLDKGSGLPPGGRRIWFNDECTGERVTVAGPEAALPYHGGVVLVDIGNPRAPTVLDFRPLPVLGGHSIVAQDLGGETRILVTVSNAALTSYYVFFGLVNTPAGARLDTHAVYESDVVAQIQENNWLGSNHDGYMQRHPATGRKLAYLADGNYGVAILDIENARTPRVLSRWDEAAKIANPDPQHFAHSILPLDTLWDGRHYTFVSEECTGRPRDTPACLVYVLDTTDPSKPALAGAWTLPHDPGNWQYPGFSPHYMAVINRTLFVAHWHAGLWALDVSSPETIQTMPVLGVFVPEGEVDYVPDGGFVDDYNMAPTLADVVAVGDHLVAFDGPSGVYVLRFDASRPMPAPDPWPLRIR